LGGEKSGGSETEKRVLNVSDSLREEKPVYTEGGTNRKTPRCS